VSHRTRPVCTGPKLRERRKSSHHRTCLVCTGPKPRELYRKSLHQTLTRMRPVSHRTRPMCTGRKLRELLRESVLFGRNTPDSRRLQFLSPVPQLGHVQPHTGRVRPVCAARKDPLLLPLLSCANTKVSQHLCTYVSKFQNIFQGLLKSSLGSNAYARNPIT